MRRFTVPALLLALVTVSVAVADNVHFKPGSPTFTDNGTTLTAAGSLAGLGNADIVITVTATGSGATTGVNPGGNSAPGQNKVVVSVTGTQTILASEIKNGTVNFSATTAEPRQPTGTEAGFPNDNWTVTVTDVVFTSATVTVTQGGTVVLTKTFKL
jgi:hypothetical protein